MYSKIINRCALAAALCAVPIMADFSYTQTSRMTGGSMLGVMKIANAFAPKGQKLTDPNDTTIALKENRMVQKSMQQTTIIDLDKQTITTIHDAKKTYSVITFEQMRQQLEQMQQKMTNNKDAQNLKASVDVHVTDTGKTQTISGVNTHEEIMTMALNATDPTTGHPGEINITMDMWLSSEVPGSSEMLAFYKRMAKELNWMPGAGAMAGRPELATALADVYKEGSKLNGLPIENVTRMGVPGQAGLTPEQQAQVNDSMGKAAQAQQQSQDQKQEQQQPTSAKDAVASALSQHFGFGHHKKQQQQDDGASSSSGTPAVGGNAVDASNAGSCNCLMEMTAKVTSFQSGGVDPAWFVIPDGYKQVEEDLVAQPGHRH